MRLTLVLIAVFVAAVALRLVLLAQSAWGAALNAVIGIAAISLAVTAGMELSRRRYEKREAELLRNRGFAFAAQTSLGFWTSMARAGLPLEWSSEFERLIVVATPKGIAMYGDGDSPIVRLSWSLIGAIAVGQPNPYGGLTIQIEMRSTPVVTVELTVLRKGVFQRGYFERRPIEEIVANVLKQRTSGPAQVK